MDTKELHENFILLHNFEHDEPLKNWVKNDETYTGHYHTDWNVLMPLVHRCLTVCHEKMLDEWENAFSDAFSTCAIDVMYDESVSFVKWFNVNNS